MATTASAEPGKDLYGDSLPDGVRMRLGTRRLRHAREVSTVAYSPDGTLLASAGIDETIRIWDPESGREIRRLVGQEGYSQSIAFTANGEYLVSGSSDNILRVWRVRTGELLHQYETQLGNPCVVTTSPDGKRVASGGSHGELVIWGSRDDALIPERTLKLESIKALAFSPDGAKLAVSGKPGPIHILESASGRTIRSLPGHGEWTYKLAYSPDGAWLASSGRDAVVRLWNCESGKVLRTFSDCKSVADGVCVSPDGQLVAAGDYWGNIFIWDVERRRCLHHITGHNEWVTDLAFSPDGKSLAAGSYDIRIFDVLSGRPRLEFEGHRQRVSSVVFSPDGRSVATAGGHSAIRVWSLNSGKVARKYWWSGHEVVRLNYSPDGRRLAAGLRFGRFLLWDTRTHNQIARHDDTERHESPRWIEFSADSAKLVFSAALGPLRILDTASGDIVGELPPWPSRFEYFKARLSALGFREDGKLGVVTNQEIHIYDLDTQVREDLGKVRRFIDGEFIGGTKGDLVAILLGVSGGLAIRSSKTGETVREIRDGDRYYQVVFSADGRFLAGAGIDRTRVETSIEGGTRTSYTADENGMVRIWDVKTGEVLTQLSGHEGRILTVAFSPDGQLLATGGDDTTVLIWDLSKILK